MIYLQGLVILDGFKTGKLKSPIFDDVKDNLKKWRENDNIDVYVWSHGTIDASKYYSNIVNMDQRFKY